MKPDWAAEIVQRIRACGHEAYFVGGCVRDMIMGLEPADYDIATSAHPDEIMHLFPRTEGVGAQFGVVLVIHRGHPFEVATFRSDDAYIDGRRPTGVSFTDARTDVFRRDFTINGLLYDPSERRIIDYVAGQDDIRDRVVRAIGSPLARFEEDKLRVLRAIRFGARFDYTIEAETWQAVRAMAPAIHQVSVERIRGEIVRILTEGRAAHGVRMLDESGLLKEILPDLEWNDHLERSLALMPRGASPDFAMATLLHEMPLRKVETLVEHLRFSRAEAHHILALVRNAPRFTEIRAMPLSALKRFFRLSRFDDHLDLARICAISSGGSLDDYSFARATFLGWSDEVIAPQPLISGEDLIDMGLKPGPLFRTILTRVEDEQLEGRLRERNEALGYVVTHFSGGKS